jgi:hypothetical protein
MHSHRVCHATRLGDSARRTGLTRADPAPPAKDDRSAHRGQGQHAEHGLYGRPHAKGSENAEEPDHEPVAHRTAHRDGDGGDGTDHARAAAPC